MHPAMLREVVKVCRQRQSDGDCPTVQAFSVEQLECAVVELAKFLPPLKLRFTDEWLRKKIASDPDIECEAGNPIITTDGN